MTYRHRPTVVDAFPYFSIEHPDPIPSPDQPVCRCPSDECGSAAHLHTLNGVVRVCEGDYVCSALRSDGTRHAWPCAPDVFQASYDPVED
jgi:hypothetical protein